jgi:hypothetical protein
MGVSPVIVPQGYDNLSLQFRSHAANGKYDPQSVEGPKGLRSCNGGIARFTEPNDNNKGRRDEFRPGTDRNSSYRRFQTERRGKA